jgi:transcriptional regulator of acetoin/glycerol metabolism
VVIDVQGAVDRHDPRSQLIGRVGWTCPKPRGHHRHRRGADRTDPVWLHRGEHFSMTTRLQLRRRPLFGPEGRCMGMLDLTGVDVPERPELRHLVARSARAIEDALLLSRPHDWLMRLNWPGGALGGESDGLVTLDDDGRCWAPTPRRANCCPCRCAAPVALCTAPMCLPCPGPCCAMRHASSASAAMPVPLWSGLRLQALVQPAAAVQGRVRASPAAPLRQTETALIRQAVQDARGNVAEARALGISRATVYRKLGQSAVKF